MLRKFEMEYYSTFMHKFRLGKRKQENYVRVPLKKKWKICLWRGDGILDMYGQGFKIYKMYMWDRGMTQQHGTINKA
jgi:hypothetical protein